MVRDSTVGHSTCTFWISSRPQNHLVQTKEYPNDPKFSDRQACPNSLDPDQTAPQGAVWSGSTLFAIMSASFGTITL